MDAPTALPRSGITSRISSQRILELSLGDPRLEKALKNLVGITARFEADFQGGPIHAESCGDPAVAAAAHVSSHRRAARWLLGVRLRDHLIDLEDALSRDRVFTAALASRGALETIAVVYHLRKSLRDDVDSGLVLEELHRVIGGGRFDWLGVRNPAREQEMIREFAEGRDPQLADGRKARNILTMVNSLDAALASELHEYSAFKGGVRMAYAMLSDICHPATGTAFLFAEPASNGITLRSEAGLRGTRWFFWNIGALVAPIAYCARNALEEISTVEA